MSFKFKKDRKKEIEPLGKVNFDTFIGIVGNLYYCNILNQFQLGNVIFEVIEDENDGYRSAMDHVEVISRDAPTLQGNFLAKVKVNYWNYGSKSVYHLVDEDNGHIWLEFGTEDYDDYYPTFIFRTFPK